MKLRKFKRLLYCQVHDEIRLYRYKNAHLLMQGVEDFLKGTGWFMKQKGDELHQSVMSKGYSMKLPEDFDGTVEINFPEYEEARHREPDLNLVHRLVYKLTENGHSLPAKRKTAIVPTAGAKPVSVYRCGKAINYDFNSGKCFVTPRDEDEARQCRKRLRKLNRLLDKQYEAAIADYHDNYKKLTSMKFWEDYLGITK